jgi:hypothetical protein
MAEESPYLGSGDQPLALGRYFQAAEGEQLPLPGGGYTEPKKLYLISPSAQSEVPVVCGGPYRSDREIEEALEFVRRLLRAGVVILPAEDDHV